jgi:hypothetical protein
MKKNISTKKQITFFATLLCSISFFALPVLAAKEDAPTNVKATASDSRISVSFDSPHSGSSYSYKVLCNVVTTSTSTGSISATGSISPIAVAAKNGQSYQCRVDIYNDTKYLWTSDWSNTVSVTSTTGQGVDVPFPPLTASAVAGNGNATIYWLAPLVTSVSPITSYTVSRSPTSIDVKTVAASGNSYAYVYTGLTNGTSYTFYIKANNASGSSTWVSTGSVTPGSSGSGATVDSSSSSGSGSGATVDGTKPTSPSNSSINFAVKNPLGTSSTDLPGFIANVLSAIVDLLFPVVVIMLLYSGFLFVVASGNTEKLGEAKKTLMYTLIGAAIVLGASGLAHVIQNTISALAG